MARVWFFLVFLQGKSRNNLRETNDQIEKLIIHLEHLEIQGLVSYLKHAVLLVSYLKHHLLFCVASSLFNVPWPLSV